MFCTKCGNFLADDARFCNSCGQPNKGYSEAISLKSTTGYKGNKILLYIWCSLLLWYGAYLLYSYLISWGGIRIGGMYLATGVMESTTLIMFGLIPLCLSKSSAYNKWIAVAFGFEAICSVLNFTDTIKCVNDPYIGTVSVQYSVIYAIWVLVCVGIIYTLFAGIKNHSAFKCVLLICACTLAVAWVVTRIELEIVQANLRGYIRFSQMVPFLIGMSIRFFFPFIALPGVVKVKQ